MRPYLAVIQDSLRESLASRVLWVLLGLITLALLGLAPLGLLTESTASFRPEEIRDIRRLVVQVRASRDASATSPANFVWRQLPESMRERLAVFRDTNEGRRFEDLRLAQDLARALSELTQQADFYDGQVWEQVDWNEEGRTLHERPFTELTSEQQRRARRLLIEAAFPQQFRPAPRQSVSWVYGIWKLDFPAMPRKAAESFISRAKLGFMAFVVGFVGILTGILATASIIPQTFSSGSIYLLLSKPVSRPLLFLAQFAGGCTFVTVAATYLIVGLWLILGLRLGAWDHRVLWAIPIFVFLFGIYYSVSAVAGLVWRNTLMAIVATVVFWLLCTIVGSSKELIELFVIRPERIVELVPAGQELFAFRQRGQVVRWHEEDKSFAPAFEISESKNELPAFITQRNLRQLVFDAPHHRMLGLKGRSQPRLLVGRQEDDWLGVDVSAAPSRTLQLLNEADGRVVAAASDGLYRFADELQPAAEGINIFGFKIPAPAKPSFSRISLPIPHPTPNVAERDDPRGESQLAQRLDESISASSADEAPTDATTTAGIDLPGFERPVSTSDPAWTSDARFASDQAGRSIFVWDDGILQLWAAVGEGAADSTGSGSPDFETPTYLWQGALTCEFEQAIVQLVAARGTVMLVDEEGRIVMRHPRLAQQGHPGSPGVLATEPSAADMQAIGPPDEQKFGPFEKVPPLSAFASDDGRWWGVHFANDRLWLYDREHGKEMSSRLPHQGDLSTAALSSDQKAVLLVQSSGEIVAVTLADFEIATRWSPRLSVLESIYLYVIRPIYFVFPKPKQLQNTMTYVITGEETVAVNQGPPGTPQIHIKLNPWAPVWSSALFTLAVLAIGCLYMHREEF